MKAEWVEWLALNLARVGCLVATIPEPVESAWIRADGPQRGQLETHLQGVGGLFPGLEDAYWACLGRARE